MINKQIHFMLCATFRHSDDKNIPKEVFLNICENSLVTKHGTKQKIIITGSTLWKLSQEIYYNVKLRMNILMSFITTEKKTKEKEFYMS